MLSNSVKISLNKRIVAAKITSYAGEAFTIMRALNACQDGKKLPVKTARLSRLSKKKKHKQRGSA